VWGEVVTVQTWPTGVNGLLAFRDFRILDSKGRISVLADSSWLVIDRDRRRPVRLPSDWKGWKFPDRRAFADRPGDRPAFAVTEESAVTQVETRDLDFNAHVNHVRYIEWMLQPLPEDVISRYRLTEMTATFMQEAVLGERLRIERSGLPSGHESIDLQHRIARLKESDTVVAATTIWNPIAK
jgi:acyl-ACP thioesterase